MGRAKSVTIGYRYSIGIHMVLCHGPVDEITEIRVGQRTAWDTPIVESESIDIDEPQLFGGEKKEGGIVGKVDIMMGEDTQGKNPYLVGQLGGIVPGFRGVVSVILNKVYVTAMTQYPKPWEFLVKNIPSPAFNPTKADINGSANPVNIVYDLLTNRDYGLGYDLLSIDTVSFTAAADALFDENFGLSFTLVNQDSVEKLLESIMSHINATFYTTHDTGQFAIKLIRDDFNVATLPIFDESNTVRLEEFQRPSYGELINEIVVVYQPIGSDEKDSVVVQDLAGIQVQQGIISQTFNYPGIDTPEIAARVAQRDLRQKSSPIAGLKIIVNRAGFNLVIGDVFKFSWAELEIHETVFRVISLNFGSYTNGEIEIGALEDFFTLPAETEVYIHPQTPIWVDPIVEADPITVLSIRESTYYDVARASSEADLAAYDDSTAFFRAAALEPSGNPHINFELHKQQGSEYVKESESEFCVSGLITAAIPVSAQNIVVEVANLSGTLDEVEADNYAYINNEMFAVLTINVNTSEVTLGRAVIDTVPAAHVGGSRIFFFQQSNARTQEEAISTGTHTFKLTARTGLGGYPIASAIPEDIIGNSRFARPYRPGNFTIDTKSFPVAVAGVGVTAAWAARSRLVETAGLEPYLSETFAEAGVTYSLDITGEGGGAIINLVGLLTTSYTLNDFEELLALPGLLSTGPARDIVVGTLGVQQGTFGDLMRSTWYGTATGADQGQTMVFIDEDRAVASLTNVDQRTDIFNSDGTVDTAAESAVLDWFPPRRWNNPRVFAFDIKDTVLVYDIDDASTYGSGQAIKYPPTGTGAGSIDDLPSVGGEGLWNADGVVRPWTMFLQRRLGTLDYTPNIRPVAPESGHGGLIFREYVTSETIQIADIEAGNLNTTTHELIDRNVAVVDQFLSNGERTEYPDGSSSFPTTDSGSPGVPYNAMVVGDLVYFQLVTGIEYHNTSEFVATDIDITATVLNNHIDFYDVRGVTTVRLRVNATGIVQEVVDIRIGHFVPVRSSTATTGFNGWEKGPNGLTPLDLQTGALGVPVPHTTDSYAGVGDKENGYFYLHLDGGLVERRDHATAALIDSIQLPPAAVETPYVPVEMRLGANHLYVYRARGASPGRPFKLDNAISVVPTGATSFTTANTSMLSTLNTVFFPHSGSSSVPLHARMTGFDMWYKSSKFFMSTRLDQEAPHSSPIRPFPENYVNIDEATVVDDSTGEPRPSDTLTFTLNAVRDNVLANLQATTHTVDRAGYGLRYGQYYGDTP